MDQVLEIGPKTYPIKKEERIFVEVAEECPVVMVDAQGVLKELVATLRPGKRLGIRVGQDAELAFMVPEGSPWTICKTKCGHDEVDPTPHELTADQKLPETLEEKLKRHLHFLVANEYGRNSAEFESFEEANDLDWDGDGVITRYEQNAMPKDTEFEEKNAIPKKEVAEKEVIETTAEVVEEKNQ